MPPHPEMDGGQSDVDEQFLISVAQLLESAHLGAFEVEIQTASGQARSGVPLSARHGANGHWWDEREFWEMFSLGDEMLRLKEIAACTVRASSTADMAQRDEAAWWSQDPPLEPGSGDDVSDDDRLMTSVSIAAGESQATRTVHAALVADDEAVPAARHLVRSLLTGERGNRARRSADATLIVTELVSNAVRHAYEPSEAGEVAIDLILDGRTLRMLVSDDGRGPRAEPAPHAEQRAGLGWLLVAELSDEFVITERGEGGTLVEVMLRLG